MNRCILLLSLLLAGMSGSLPAMAATPPSDKQVLMDQTFERLGAEFVKADRSDGLSIAVVKDGQARFYNFGTLSREKPQLPTEHTVYEIASISKVFTSLLLAHAVIEGKVNLQDDIRRYLPGDYPNLVFDGEPVRLIHLANTTSALPDNLPDFTKLMEGVSLDEAPFRISAAIHGYSNRQLLEDLKSAKLSARPGTAPRHSNLATELLAIILEKVYGDSYEHLLSRYVEKPFGMARGSDLSRAAQAASGYNPRHVAMPLLDARTILAAGGLRYSTADMAQFLKAELAAADAATRLSQRPTWGDPDKTAVAFNWTVDRMIDGKPHLRTSGGAFGYSSYIEMYPASGYGIVLLANRSGAAQNEMQELAAKALQEIQGKPRVQQALEDALEKAGYRNVGKVVAQVRSAHPELHLTEDYVNQWAYRLMAAGHPEQAIGLFMYNTEQWPKSWNAFDSLAEGYEHLGDTSRAITNYRRSLALNAGNSHATEHLEKLGAPADK